jgi:hypothetical protein
MFWLCSRRNTTPSLNASELPACAALGIIAEQQSKASIASRDNGRAGIMIEKY